MGDILFLAHRIPYPPDRGDKIRSFHILKHLAARHRVHLVAFADDAADLAGERALSGLIASSTIVPRTKSRARAAAEALASGRPISLAAFDDPALRAAVDRVLADPKVDLVYVFSGQMAQYLPQGSGQRVLMDFVDMDSAKFAAYAEAARGPKAWAMRREARLLGRFERAVAARAEASLFVSEAEAAPFRAIVPGARVLAVENGIDAAFYDPALPFDAPASGPLIVFTGQMDYPPNVEAVRWFATNMLPAIRRAHPAARFAIVGRAPTSEVRALASDGVIVTGAVPDVRPWLAAAACVVAPLRLARGIQNKVLEAMAMARPVVASTAAAEGIDHAGTILVGADGEAIATAVFQTLDQPAMAAARGAAARLQVLARYAWPARLASLDALFAGEVRQAA